MMLTKVLMAAVATAVLAGVAMAAPTQLYCGPGYDGRTGENVTAPFSRLYVSRTACEDAKRGYWQVAGTGEVVTLESDLCVCRGVQL
jgi:hypothetical protein